MGGLGRVGFALVVIAADGSLLGCGSGRPPAWADDSASAEGWALYMALWHMPGSGRLAADCRGLLDALGMAIHTRTGPKAALARLWIWIGHVLDQVDLQGRLRQVRHRSNG